MKLVDILARELKEWPEGVEQLTQSQLDNELYKTFSEDQSYMVTGISPRVDLETHHTEREPYPIVTRAEWQAAVDALNDEENSAPAWSGEGLPPVGTWCEILSTPEPKGAWHKGKILYISKSSCVWCWEESQIDMSANTFEMEFRPVRTAEQIAAEERTKAIDDMVRVTCINRGEAARIYDAGYRKQVKP